MLFRVFGCFQTLHMCVWDCGASGSAVNELGWRKTINPPYRKSSRNLEPVTIMRSILPGTFVFIFPLNESISELTWKPGHSHRSH